MSKGLDEQGTVCAKAEARPHVHVMAGTGGQVRVPSIIRKEALVLGRLRLGSHLT